MKDGLYLLDEQHNVVLETDLRKWSDNWHNCRRVALHVINGIKVSTVFLGMPHQNGMFETMIFGGLDNDYQERCETYEEALKMHERACIFTLEHKSITK